ncbi:MAG TPA: glycosyltransferase [Kofleriaceae bacterium]|nr:glycosyltransferase [Kofleriaceae bacterium]
MFRHDVLCLGDVPWSRAGVRTRHLLGRAARDRFVFYWEPAIHGEQGEPRVELDPGEDGVMIATPHLPFGLDPELAEAAQRALVDDLIATQRLVRPVLWYQTPHALGFTRHVRARAVVYDCLGPSWDQEKEAHLLRRADVVLAAGHALAETLRPRADHVHVVTAGIDADPFVAARGGGATPIDLARLPHPRIGFAGAIDDRIDLELIDALAARRPDVHVVMLGGVSGDPARLPRRPNLHWLGHRDDAARPMYLAALDAAILPFRRDDAHRTCAPHEVLEAIAAGLPVIATPLRDLAKPYAEAGVVRLAACARTISTAIDEVLADDPHARLARADQFLAERTWEHAWANAWQKIAAVLETRATGVHMRVTGVSGASGVSAEAAPRRRRAPARPR